MTGLLAAVLAAAGPANAASISTATFVSTAAFVSPSTATFARAEGVIDRLSVRRLNVFDPSVPGENWWPFRIANRIHVMTREDVVRREFIQGPGETYAPLHALEVERNLRSYGFIRKAEVRPVPRPGGKLDLALTTQDAWTLAPQLSVGTEGGDKYFIWGIEEGNLLGLGKAVSLFHSQVGPLTRNEFRYRDPRLAGSRQRLTGLYAQTPKGDEIGALIDRPFYSLDSPYAMQLQWARIIQEDIRYRDAEEHSKFIQNFHSVDASLAAKINADADPVQRILLGTHYQRDRFQAEKETVAGSLPADRELSGPVVGYSLIQPRFVKETYIDRMERVEDFNMGNEFSVFGGPMLRSWGSSSDEGMLNVLEQQGLRLSEGRFLLGQAGVAGRLHAGRVENGLAYGNLNLFWKTTVLPIPQTFVIHGEINAGRNLDAENQLLLGGSTGLRGYKNNSFTGSKSLLVNVEDRLFLTKELLHLFYVGAVGFFDTGTVTEEAGGYPSHFKSDVGVGLRFASSRSTSGSVLRLDLARALSPGPGGSQWVLSIRGGQAFQIFNSTNRNVLRTPSSAVGEESAGVRLRKR